MDSDARIIAACESRVGGALAGKWQLRRLLGIGSSAAVYEGVADGAPVAIKLLHAAWATHPAIRARFAREAYIGNSIEHHGVVRVLEDGVSEDGEPFLVMELLRGASLDVVMAQNNGTIPDGDALWVIDGILAVLERAHALGVVHRDLKPENVFLTQTNQVKVLDFGIARLRQHQGDDGHTREGVVMGTPAFMAPEQAIGRWSEVDARSDIWSVGAILFTLLTGRPVHGDAVGNEMLIRAATQKAPALARVRPAVPELCRLVDTALTFQSGRRFQSAGAMRHEVQSLLGFQSEAPMSVRSVVVAPPPSVPRSFSPEELKARVAAESIVDRRFAHSVIVAYRKAESRGATSGVTEAVRAGLRRLAATAPDTALELILALFAELDAAVGREDPEARQAFATAVVSTRALGALLTNAGRPGVDQDAAVRALTLVLDALGDEHAGVALEALGSIVDGRLKDLLVDYVARTGRGYEEPMAGLLAQAEPQLAFVMLRVLEKMGTDVARAAMARGEQSPHQAVRIKSAKLLDDQPATRASRTLDLPVDSGAASEPPTLKRPR